MIFAIVHYNTPELLTCCISSVLKNYPDAHIVIFENSDKRKFENVFDNNVSVINNSDGKIINFNLEIENLIKQNNLNRNKVLEDETKVSNFGSFKHSLSVQYLLDIIDEDFILLDSDVLLKRKLDIELNNSVAICDFNTYRILPFIIKFNQNIIKKYKLLFCDHIHILPVKAIPNYDTGGFFLTQIIENKLKLQKINYNDYVVHYGNGSWKENGNKKSSLNTYKMDKFEWLNKFKNLWK